jgi:hypothetical protein
METGITNSYNGTSWRATIWSAKNSGYGSNIKTDS